MSRILCIGIATLDIINTVEHYPAEDEEIRALAQRVCRGGNAANSAAVLRQYGHEVELMAVTAAEPDGQRIEQELQRQGVGRRYLQRLAQGKSPTSYITLNQRNGSRSIVHYRDLPELDAAHFIRALETERFDWFHFEGRNVEQTLLMLEHLQQQSADQPISIEIEKPRADIERLYSHADVLLFSRAFVTTRGHPSAAAFFDSLPQPANPPLRVCSWGETGAYARDQQGRDYFSPACPPPRVVDTLGAGDTFNAGLIHALLGGQNLELALGSACELAGRKVGQSGLDKLV